MTNKLYTIDIVTNKMNNIAAALTSYYGANITVYYVGTTDIVFSIPSLTSKVIKISITDYIAAYYGDAWTSGSTITDSRTFLGFSAASIVSLKMVLCETSLNLFPISSTVGAELLHIGKLTNGKEIAIGMGNNSSYSTNYKIYLMETDVLMRAVGMGTSFSSNGKLFTQPIVIRNASTGEAELNGDGSLAATVDLKNISATVTGNHIFGDNFVMTPYGMVNATYSVPTSLYIAVDEIII